jgi:hypothetical protein
MANPFPGVNPYIEVSGRWLGFHNVLIADLSKTLNQILPANYVAFVEERLEVAADEFDGGLQRQRRPDVSIVRDLYSAPAGTGGAAAVLDVEPAVRTLAAYEELPESYIDIRSVPDQELITCVELLSPTNKVAPGRGEYWTKRAGLLRGTASLVEVDLLLGGRRPQVREPMPDGDFFAMISRGDRRPQCEVYAWSIRRRLPRLPIPLRAGEPDVIVDLAAAYETTYAGGRYDHAVRYERPLAGPLSDADRAWVAERVAAVHR